ncbi:SymE family type I addiction module toxin [Lachnospiraceae bacterium SGI.085]
MAYKEHRELKVYETSGRNYKSIPQIRLQGDWLKDFDFDIGTPINVECRGGAILITKANEIIGRAVEL